MAVPTAQQLSAILCVFRSPDLAHIDIGLQDSVLSARQTRPRHVGSLACVHCDAYLNLRCSAGGAYVQWARVGLGIAKGMRVDTVHGKSVRACSSFAHIGRQCLVTKQALSTHAQLTQSAAGHRFTASAGDTADQSGGRRSPSEVHCRGVRTTARAGDAVRCATPQAHAPLPLAAAHACV
jgi:hypothetical protein